MIIMPIHNEYEYWYKSEKEIQNNDGNFLFSKNHHPCLW